MRSTTQPIAKSAHSKPRRVVVAVLDLLSNLKFGIWLLVALFVYSSIGSAGIVYPEHWAIFSADSWVHDQVRQWRGLEMTEFEWFHWWPFTTMLLLIALSIVVTTLRRIPFTPVHYGVWMIHGGILLLIAGSFVYFGQKVEGDTPVARRKVVAEFAVPQTDGSVTNQRVEFVASPGQRAEIGEGSSRVNFEVRSVDPQWELLTGADKGKRAYSVTVLVERAGKRYLRQLLAGYPALTEDLLITDDQAQPIKRAVEELGKPISDESMVLSLEYTAQRWFYLRNDLAKSWALYVRLKGTTKWTQRPIDGLPLYNDCVAQRDDVFQLESDESLPLHPLDVRVGAFAADDPLRGVDLRVSGYLRFAVAQTRVTDGGANAALNPIASVTVSSTQTKPETYRLVAHDAVASKADGGVLRLVDLDHEAAFERFTRQPSIVVRIPSQNIEVREEIRDVAAANPNAPFVEIMGAPPNASATGYAYRVVNVQDSIPIAGGTVAVAILEVKTPQGFFRRWVFENPTLTRDVVTPDARDAHGAPKLEDDSIDIRFEPGNGLALVVLAHGPELGRLRLISAVGATPAIHEVAINTAIPIGAGVSVKVAEFFPRGRFETKPLVVPRLQRSRDAMETFAQIRVEAAGAGDAQWIPFTRWVFDSAQEALRRAPFEPHTLRLSDGREVEVLFSRQRLPLGSDVALDEFVLTSHVGGYTGEDSTIRDYRSRLRFRGDGTEAAWSEPVDVSVNSPVEHEGLWYFQAQWDPPETRPREGEVASAGLNYTVLGVGNREGVHLQLLGCCVAVTGMLYAFYLKPIVKRRRQAGVLAELAAAAKRAGLEGRADEGGAT